MSTAVSVTHTPGPWTRGDDGLIRATDGGFLFDLTRSSAERDATANLIAAAPDLLAALIAVRDWNAQTHVIGAHSVAGARLMDRIDDALAAAEGK